MLRVDKGTETGTMATMHAFLRRHHNDMDPHETVIYGPSTSNQVWKCSVYFLSKLKLVEVELGTGYLAIIVGREKAIGGQDLPLPPALLYASNSIHPLHTVYKPDINNIASKTQYA